MKYLADWPQPARINYWWMAEFDLATPQICCMRTQIPSSRRERSHELWLIESMVLALLCANKAMQ